MDREDRRIGEKQWKAKLVENDIVFIRNTELSQKELAEKFEVSQQCISNILTRRTWKGVK